MQVLLGCNLPGNNPNFTENPKYIYLLLQPSLVRKN